MSRSPFIQPLRAAHGVLPQGKPRGLERSPTCTESVADPGIVSMLPNPVRQVFLIGYVVMRPCAVPACSDGDISAEVTASLTVISDDFNVYNRVPLITLSKGSVLCVNTSWTQAYTSVLSADQVGIYFRVWLKDYSGIASTKYLLAVDAPKPGIPYVLRPDGKKIYCDQPGAFSVSGCPNADR